MPQLLQLFLLSFNLFLILLSYINSLGYAAFSNETDRLALLAFKDGITKDPLGSLSSWNDSLHFCEWEGITCSYRHQNRVTVLDLPSRKLVGSINPHIGNLTFLKQVSLQSNNFLGSIPQEIGRLLRLQHLNLSNNAFEGEIPTNLTHCSELGLLNLNYNQLVGTVPVQLGSLTKLYALGLSSNNLTGKIPTSIANLTSLERLSLAINNLEGPIPPELVQVSTLQFFQVAQNNLSGVIPSGFFNLSNLYLFSVSSNNLHGSFPPDIGITLPNLIMFHTSRNRFSGPIPISLSNASGLASISLSYNEFTGPVPVDLGRLESLFLLTLVYNQLGGSEKNDLRFIDSLSNCSALQVLDISGNRFKGLLPVSVANLSTQLRALMIEENEISGAIPKGIENLVGLTILGTFQNLITGEIPVGIGKFPRLQEIDLSVNRISGSIPSSLGNLTLLNRLYLSSNGLSGEIPSSLGNFQSLQGLDLSGNNLNGTIPKQILSLSSLTISLNLAQNSLTGSLSMEVGNLINLGNLDVSRNKLRGEIPSTLGNCLLLELLNLEGNFFQGTIPQTLSSLKGIQVLDLSSNNFSGKIPGYLESFRVLQNLNLSFNHFDGQVPNGGVFRNASAVSVLGNDKLCGGITELQLEPCHNTVSKKHGMSHSLRIIILVISLVVFLFLLVVFVALCWMWKSRQKLSSASSSNDKYQVSYAELLQATGGFSSDNLIGVGSFGSVYKGLLDSGEKPVAVKVLNLQQRGASKSFIAECEALRNIRHRNLVKILTSCSSTDYKGNDFSALIFDYMPNGSLDSWLHSDDNGEHRSKNLNLLQRLNVAIDVASAMDYLHNRCQIPIVHCDLKPSNILLDVDMNARVGDFGLARFLVERSNNSSQNPSSTIGIKGTIGYVAPEYGIGGEVSIKGDVYSFGILLLEMFTGKRPTNNMFKDGLSLYSLAKVALPERVVEIVDPTLFLEGEEDDNYNAMNAVNDSRDQRERIVECLVSVIRIGVMCSTESPSERMDMVDVEKKLRLVRDTFLDIGINVMRQN